MPAKPATYLTSFRPTLLRGRFARRLTFLSGGTFLGQAILTLSSPVLTRLYTPTEFGALAVFTALASMLIVGMALRYEFAIPVCRDDEDALAMVAVSGLAVTLLAASLALAVLILGGPLAELLGLGDLAHLLWLLPPILWIWGLSMSLAGWSIRRGSFRVQAAANLAQFATQASAQLGLGALGGGAGGLVIGYSLGPLARVTLLWNVLRAGDRAALRRVSPARLWAVARAHWRYPVFSSSSSVLQSASQMLPAVLVAALYGPAAAGLFGLTQRIMGAPVRMLAEAASQVYLSEIARADGAALYRLFRRTALVFLVAGLVGATPLLLVGPSLFALAFGEAWREAGTLVQLLVPLYLARFVVVPISQTLNVTGQQHLHLTASVLNVLTLAGSFSLGSALALPMTGTILLYSLGSTTAFLFYLVAAWRSAKLAARGQVPLAPPVA